MISVSTLAPLASPDSLIADVRAILEYCRRPELEYRALIHDFEFAMRGVINLVNISSISGPDGEPLVSSHAIQKIYELNAYVIESNRTAWQIYMQEVPI